MIKTHEILAAADPLIAAWCLEQTAHWRCRDIDYAQALNEFRHFNETRHGTFLFRFSGGAVELVDKPPHLYSDILKDRSTAYLGFFQSIAPKLRLSKELVLAVEVGDGPLNSETVPVFSFQKNLGDPTILLPDVNLIEGDFYERAPYVDTKPYRDKLDKAIFVGSTSGLHNTVETIKAKQNPRLNAALFFKHRPEVDFELPNIVQCDPDAADLIRQMDIGTKGIVSWAEQFKYKFLISIDGNGATCQRLAVALKSNSAVLKYESNSRLFYFSALVPWCHYVPINSDPDVLQSVRMARLEPSSFQRIAENGRIFYEAYLTRGAICQYTSFLFRIYEQLFAFA